MQSIAEMVECPVCLDTMTSTIRQCQEGHSICENCVIRINQCPLCEAPISSARNYQLEKVIANLRETQLKQPYICKYKQKGCEVECKSLGDLTDHQLECKRRDYVCEGKLFADWQCDWSGGYQNIFQHFKIHHNKHSWMELETSIYMKIDFSRDFADIQIIPHRSENQLFWYKCKVDPWREKSYWLIQYIGPETEANNYFYEFTIKHGPLRLFKSREICKSDSCNANSLFSGGKCVTVPFSTLKNYLNENNEIAFTFIIGSVKGCAITEETKANLSAPANMAQNTQGHPLATSLLGQQMRYHRDIVANANMGMPFRRTFNNFSSSPFFQYQGMPFSSQFDYNNTYRLQPQLMPPIMYHPHVQFPYLFPAPTIDWSQQRHYSK